MMHSPAPHGHGARRAGHPTKADMIILSRGLECEHLCDGNRAPSDSGEGFGLETPVVKSNASHNVLLPEAVSLWLHSDRVVIG